TRKPPASTTHIAALKPFPSLHSTPFDLILPLSSEIPIHTNNTMSQTPQSTTFDMLNSKPGLSWADEMNELAEAEEIGSLPTLPAWTPLQELSSIEEHGSHAAEVDNSTASLQDFFYSDNIYAEGGAEDFSEEACVENVDSGTEQASDNSFEENAGGLTDNEMKSPCENEQQNVPSCGTFSYGEDEAVSSEEMSPSTGSFFSGEDKYEGKSSSFKHKQSPGNSTSSSTDFESEFNLSERGGYASSASGDDYDPFFAPYHPGWTKLLSPSIKSYHSTPPEVNKWAFSAPIGYALQQDLDSARLDDDCPNLARPATVSCALLYTDNDLFNGYAFPYGARGLKRPLPKPFPPRRRSQVGQRSRLWQVEAVEYSQDDLSFDESNLATETHSTQPSLEEELETVDTKLEVPVNQPLVPQEESDSDSSDKNDLWSPLTEGDGQGSTSSVDSDGYETKPLKNCTRTWRSVSEPYPDFCNTFDSEGHHHARDTSFRYHQSPVAYLDLAMASTACHEDFSEVRDDYELCHSHASCIVNEETTQGSTGSAVDRNIDIKPMENLPERSRGIREESEVDTRSDAGTINIDNESPRESVQEDSDDFTGFLDLAIAIALPDVDVAEDFIEHGHQKPQRIEPVHEFVEEPKEEIQDVGGKTGGMEEVGVRFFGGIMATGRFLLDCLNDRPLVLDNPW
ncbi:hypothetical protein IWX46DRAFT_660339, partial [Phyllosticta citricarpa]